MAAASPVLWWKFPLPGMGTHLLRVRNVGEANQEVLLDGTALDAPPGTMQFTGPAASFLELQRIDDGSWTLIVDGSPVEAYVPDPASADGSMPVMWWKFSLPNMGTHHLRVKSIGLPGQEILLDGSPLDAPAGTLAFTGPGGALLQLIKHEGIWVLAVDGVVVQQRSPQGSGEGPSSVWNFVLPSTGRPHQVCAMNLESASQQVAIDGLPISAPAGTKTFTGPAGCLLELQKNGDSWVLLVDGIPVEPKLTTSKASGAETGTTGPTTEASWTFFGPSTGLAHQIKAVNMGRKGQQVYINGTLIPGPDGQTAFTGPEGVLLELQERSHDWELMVDGVTVEDHNTKVTMSGAVAATGARAPVSSGMSLPQGVTQDPATGKYTANIRIKGKFKCLGEFSSPDQAHARYLEEKKALGDA